MTHCFLRVSWEEGDEFLSPILCWRHSPSVPCWLRNHSGAYHPAVLSLLPAVALCYCAVWLLPQAELFSSTGSAHHYTLAKYSCYRVHLSSHRVPEFLQFFHSDSCLSRPDNSMSALFFACALRSLICLVKALWPCGLGSELLLGQEVCRRGTQQPENSSEGPHCWRKLA